MWFIHRLAAFGIATTLLAGQELLSEEATTTPRDGTLNQQAEEAMLSKTLSGRQFWGDVHSFQGWRIQQNVFTKHYRLNDPQGVRHCWGSFEECLDLLKKIRDEQKMPEMTGAAVVMVHGLLQSSKCMAEMGTTLRDAGYTTIEFDYPSTQVSIPEAARFLDRLVQSLAGFDEINFVVHSMGGLVVRAYAMEYDDPRIKRMVMLGTPNRGAELADITHQYWLLRTVAGPGARQLGTRSDGLIPKLPIPKFEFAVIAGSRGTASGWNPLIPGDDDGTVTVASTRLRGATDFSTVHAIHSRLLWNEEAIAQTVSFLKDGRLRPDRDARPIHDDDVAQGQLPTSKRIPDISHR